MGQKLKKQARSSSLSSPMARFVDGVIDDEDLEPDERKRKLIDDLINTVSVSYLKPYLMIHSLP